MDDTRGFGAAQTFPTGRSPFVCWGREKIYVEPAALSFGDVIVLTPRQYDELKRTVG